MFLNVFFFIFILFWNKFLVLVGSRWFSLVLVGSRTDRYSELASIFFWNFFVTYGIYGCRLGSNSLLFFLLFCWKVRYLSLLLSFTVPLMLWLIVLFVIVPIHESLHSFDIRASQWCLNRIIRLKTNFNRSEPISLILFMKMISSRRSIPHQKSFARAMISDNYTVCDSQ